jgi:predicted HTH domain antitoxin
MRVTVHIPDSIAKALFRDKSQGGTKALELMLLEAYRRGELSHGQLGEALGLSFHATEELLNKHRVEAPFSAEDFDEQMETLRRIKTA